MMKTSYKKRVLSSLFDYYPIDSIIFNSTNQEKLNVTLKKLGILSAFEKTCDQLPSVVFDNTLMGLEIEVERVPTSMQNVFIPFITQIEDPSLRDNGKEFITAPASPAMIRQLAIAELLVFKKLFDGKPRFTWRTSDHVHLNMRDSTVESLCNLILLYVLFEDTIFSFVGEERRSSNFCVPIIETNLCNNISSILQGHDTLPGMIHNWQKYSALNTRPICFNDHGGHGSGKGTIEFRHLEGTYDIEKLITWLNIILCLKNKAANISLEQLEDRIFGIETKDDYIFFLKEVFGAGKTYSALPVKDFDHILYSSVAYAKECFAPSVNLSELIKQIGHKKTGLSEMIKIRSKFKKKIDEKDLEVKKLKAELDLQSQWQSLNAQTMIGEWAAHTFTTTPDNDSQP